MECISSTYLRSPGSPMGAVGSVCLLRTPPLLLALGPGAKPQPSAGSAWGLRWHNSAPSRCAPRLRLLALSSPVHLPPCPETEPGSGMARTQGAIAPPAAAPQSTAGCKTRTASPSAIMRAQSNPQISPKACQGRFRWWSLIVLHGFSTGFPHVFPHTRRNSRHRVRIAIW